VEKLNQTLSAIFYLIWIPLGLLILAGIVFLAVVNPFAGIMQMMGGGSSAESGTDPGGGFQPTEEMIRQFMEQGQIPEDLSHPSQ